MKSKETTMKSPRILLLGIDGVFNYGCEAIVRGTEAIILRECPNADVVFASRRPTDDRKGLTGSKVRIIESGRYRRYSIKNIIRKSLSLVGISWFPIVDSLSLLKFYDAVLSIGGDVYTLGSGEAYSLSPTKFGDAAEKRGVPYILWGASVGPFSKNPKAEKAFTKHLKELSLISAREAETVDYLRTLGVCDNVIMCADPAFVVAPEIKANGIRQGDKYTIGINLSPLSIRYSNLSEEEAIHSQAKTIEGLIRAFEARIVLIPHVVCDFSEGNDDLRYLRRLKHAIATEYQESLSLLETNLGFIGTKKELVKCDVVIAARMHCAINALAAQVPTILVAYSRKAMGMCQYVYGSDDWVLPINDFNTAGLLDEMVRAMKNNESQVRNYLEKRIPDIQQESYRPMQKLKAVLGV